MFKDEKGGLKAPINIFKILTGQFRPVYFVF